MERYYNEHDGFAAEWIRNLIAAGALEPGRVDARDLRAVSADEVGDESHFFAGIGGWPLALRMSRWPRGLGVWTGSCPCQPFSTAGRRRGVEDERHLWPTWFELIRERRPPIVFGEQVASRGGLAWWDVVSTDLEGAGYAVGAADLCAAGIGAPHIRQRLFWVAVSDVFGRGGIRVHLRPRPSRPGVSEARRGSETHDRWDVWYVRDGEGEDGSSTATWLRGRDGTRRPVGRGVRPMVDGVPGRVGQVRAYGNAIVPQVGAAFIEAVMDVLGIAR